MRERRLAVAGDAGEPDDLAAARLERHVPQRAAERDPADRERRAAVPDRLEGRRVGLLL